MKKINKYLYSFLFGLIIMIISSLLLTLIYFFNLINDTFYNILKLIIPIISIFISGLLIGKKSLKKGWINGIYIGLAYLIFFILINIIFINKFNIGTLIYYPILLLSSVFGSMIGINKK